MEQAGSEFANRHGWADGYESLVLWRVGGCNYLGVHFPTGCDQDARPDTGLGCPDTWSRRGGSAARANPEETADYTRSSPDSLPD